MPATDEARRSGGGHAGSRGFARLATTPLRLALTYAVAGAAWIVATDRAVALLDIGQQGGPAAQTVKGLLYVAVTAVGVYWLARRAVGAAVAARERAQLKETRQLLERILAGLDEAVFVIDPRDRTVVSCNPAAEELFGYRQEELAGGTTRVLYEDDDAYHRFGEASGRVLDEGGVFRTEFRMRRRDGSALATENTVAAIDDARGWRHGVVSIVRDVTRRKQIADALRVSESHLQTLVDTIPDLVWLKDVDGVYLTCNPTFERFFGAAREAIVGRTDHDFVPGELADFFRENDRRALEADGPTVNEEWLTFAADGYRGLFETVKTPMRDAEGRVIGVLGIARDITARQRTEQELRRSRELLAIAGDLAGVGGWSYDAEGDAVFWTDTLRRILEVPPDFAPTRQDILEHPFFAPEDRPALREGFRRALDEGVPFETERPFRTAMGRERLAHLLCRPDGHEGRGRRLFGTFRDITDRRALEARLLQAQKLESVGRLAGGLAHDYNNMLSVILGSAELLLEALPAGGFERARAEEILRAGQRSAVLTRQLLAFGSRQAVAPSVIDVDDAVATILRMLERLVGEGVTLRWQPATEPARVYMDPGQIDQILVNLVVNARDALGGSGVVAIGNEAVDYAPDRLPRPDMQPGRWVRLTVSDDGPGLDAATRDRIFEPFFTTKTESQGTGLGLATVYGIVKQNGGFIDVESAPGQGTRFRIHLPCSPAEAAVDGEEAGDGEPARGSETVLLVEDQAQLLEVARRMLERLGYRVVEAHGPEAALEAAEAPDASFDLLMTDVVMPGMNGRELWRTIAARHPDARCLFMSGHTADVFASRMDEGAGMGFLPKPFSIHSLAAALRRVLDG